MAQLLLEQIVDCGVATSVATSLLPTLNQCLALPSAVECWQHLAQVLQSTDAAGKPLPFALHQLLYATACSDHKQDILPAWIPTHDQIQTTHLFALMQQLGLTHYEELHAWSTQHRAEFWQIMIQRLGIRLQQNYSRVLDLSQGVEFPRWLVDARLNIVESCFQAPEDAPAIVFPSELGTISTVTYGELNTLTNQVANGLVNAGFGCGDAIAIIMPMTVEAVAIYLGIIKAGGIVVSIADSFAASEIAVRLQVTNAKAIFTQDFVVRAGKRLPLYAKVVDAEAPTAIVLSQAAPPFLRPGDLSWSAFLSSNCHFDAIAADSSAYVNILFSSGTTGIPKAIPWTQTTPIKSAVDGHLHHDIHPGDVVAWYTNLGWMMGPWLIYASLINQATIALYWNAPDRGYGQFIQNAGVTMLGVVPSLVNTWKTTNCMQGLDWSRIKAFSSTGESSNAQDMLFLMSLAGYKPIVEYCGGTEIGGGYITGTLVQPCAPSTFTTPALGLDLVILGPEGNFANKGEAFLIPPSIGLSTELLNHNHHEVYFAGAPALKPSVQASPDLNLIPLRRHGDQLERLANGYYRAHGRVDDTMNLRGIKVSSAEIERILNTIENIAETAAIAVTPAVGGPSLLVIYAVVTLMQPEEVMLKIMQAAIAQHLNPLFKIYDLVIVEALPRTASNKIMRRVLRDQYFKSSGTLKRMNSGEPLPQPLPDPERKATLWLGSPFYGREKG